MTASAPESLRQGGSEPCAHPWLRVTCGECGASLDDLSRQRAATGGAPSGHTTAGEAGAPPSQALFVVSRGHPELVDQLQTLLGDAGWIRVIEDRRRVPRTSGPGEPEAPTMRTELRRKVLGDEPGSTS